MRQFLAHLDSKKLLSKVRNLLKIGVFHWKSASLTHRTLWQICLIQSDHLGLSDRSILSNQRAQPLSHMASLAQIGLSRTQPLSLSHLICLSQSDWLLVIDLWESPICERVRSVRESDVIYLLIIGYWSVRESPICARETVCERVQSVYWFHRSASLTQIGLSHRWDSLTDRTLSQIGLSH